MSCGKMWMEMKERGGERKHRNSDARKCCVGKARKGVSNDDSSLVKMRGGS